MAVVTDLYVYPIKSCKGIRVDSADLWETGLYLDRLWMLVDEAGRFLPEVEEDGSLCARCAEVVHG